MKYTPEHITELPPNHIFVFGSNLSGIHGAGAAKIAHKYFGAKYGCGHYICGNSYAIPTKDSKLCTLPLNRIKAYICTFILHCKDNQHLTFMVTKIGCGLVGYSVEDIAPFFKECVGMKNVILPEEFVDFNLKF